MDRTRAASSCSCALPIRTIARHRLSEKKRSNAASRPGLSPRPLYNSVVSSAIQESDSKSRPVDSTSLAENANASSPPSRGNTRKSAISGASERIDRSTCGPRSPTQAHADSARAIFSSRKSGADGTQVTGQARRRIASATSSVSSVADVMTTGTPGAMPRSRTSAALRVPSPQDSRWSSRMFVKTESVGRSHRTAASCKSGDTALFSRTTASASGGNE